MFQTQYCLGLHDGLNVVDTTQLARKGGNVAFICVATVFMQCYMDYRI